jgi:hypothetical protein
MKNRVSSVTQEPVLSEFTLSLSKGSIRVYLFTPVLGVSLS